MTLFQIPAFAEIVAVEAYKRIINVDTSIP